MRARRDSPCGALVFALACVTACAPTVDPVDGDDAGASEVGEGEGEGEGEGAEGEGEGEGGEGEGEPGEAPACGETWSGYEAWWPAHRRGSLTLETYTWDRSRVGMESETNSWFGAWFARPTRDHRNGWCGVVRDPQDGVDDCEVIDMSWGWGEGLGTDDHVGTITVSTTSQEWVVPYDGYAYGAALEPTPFTQTLSFAAPGGDQPAFDFVDVLTVPPALTPVTVSTDADALPLDEDLVVGWTGTTDGTILISLGQFVTATGHGINARCTVVDDGEFTVPAAVLAWFNDVDAVSLNVDREAKVLLQEGAYVVGARVGHALDFAVP